MNDTVLAAEQGRFGAIEPDHGHAGTPSLPQVHRSIAVPRGDSRSDNARRVLAFAGPGYMVAVGYMDPGNWATSIAGGSQFGYSLLADRKSTRLNSSHSQISYAVFCLKKKKRDKRP